MLVVNKIDHLITELTKLKPTLSDDSPSNEKRFNEILTSSLATNHKIADEKIEVAFSTNAKPADGIPSWVDSDYGYDPQNPRKPNMRELMEAISGKDLEDLRAGTEENWRKISHQASHILYGVVGSNDDTRDWMSIMASENVLVAAREQTRVMYEPKVEIQSNFNNNGIMTEQTAIVKDSKGNTLTSMSSNIISTEETLLNFGATKDSIPEDLEERINPEKFDDKLLSFLKSFDYRPTSVKQVVIQSATEVIANKLSQEIPPDELAKL